jgi:hypothetical protein
MSSPDPILPAPWAAGIEPAAPAARWGPPQLDRLASKAHRHDDRPNPDDVEGVAYAKGMEEGFRLAREQAKTALVPVHQLMAGIARELEREQLVARQSAEQKVAALAAAVARWLFQREVVHDPAIVQNLVRRAVHLLPTTTMIEIRAHPADLEAMTANLQITEADGEHPAADFIVQTGYDGPARIIVARHLVDGRDEIRCAFRTAEGFVVHHVVLEIGERTQYFRPLQTPTGFPRDGRARSLHYSSGRRNRCKQRRRDL